MSGLITKKGLSSKFIVALKTPPPVPKGCFFSSKKFILILYFFFLKIFLSYHLCNVSLLQHLLHRNLLKDPNIFLKDFFPISIRGFGILLVIGLSLLPNPAAKIIAFFIFIYLTF